MTPTEPARVVCVDQVIRRRGPERIFAKLWDDLAPGGRVVEPNELGAVDLRGVVLLVFHHSADAEEKIRALAPPRPYALGVAASGLSFETADGNRFCRSAVEVPSGDALRHLRPAFERLVRELAAIPLDANDEPTAEQRREAWENWEAHTGRDYELALYALCSWSADADAPAGTWEDPVWWVGAIGEASGADAPTGAARRGLRHTAERPNVKALLDAIDAGTAITKPVVAGALDELCRVLSPDSPATP